MIVHEAIRVSFQWAGIHRWPKAEGRHEYLQHPHRHLFKGVATIEVFDSDRELEFLAVKDFLEEDVLPEYKDLGARSCELMAREIITNLTARYGAHRDIEVEVSEDGENGAVVKWSGPKSASAVED